MRRASFWIGIFLSIAGTFYAKDAFMAGAGAGMLMFYILTY